MCLRVLKRKYDRETRAMNDLEFEDWLHEQYNIQKRADAQFRQLSD